MSTLCDILKKLRYVKSGDVVLCDDFNNKLDFLNASLNYISNKLPDSVNVCSFEEPNYNSFETLVDVNISIETGVYDVVQIVPLSCIDRKLLFFVALTSESEYPRIIQKSYFVKLAPNNTYEVIENKYTYTIYINIYFKSCSFPTSKYSLFVDEVLNNNVLYATLNIYKNGSNVFSNTYKIFDFNNKNIHSFYRDWYFMCKDPVACLVYAFNEESGKTTLRFVVVGGSG